MGGEGRGGEGGREGGRGGEGGGGKVRNNRGTEKRKNCRGGRSHSYRPHALKC